MGLNGKYLPRGVVSGAAGFLSDHELGFYDLLTNIEDNRAMYLYDKCELHPKQLMEFRSYTGVNKGH
jgi:hypothetical protein